MHELIIGAHLAHRASQELAMSARPNAPVVADPDPVRRHHEVRLGLAGRLRRLADRLEPATPQGA